MGKVLKYILTFLCILTLSTYCIYAEDTCSHINTYEKEENKIEATCTKDGSYDKVIVCEDCNEEISRETITINKLGHDYQEVIEPATRSKDGTITNKCTRCDKIKSTSTILYAKTFTLSSTSYTYNGKVKTPSVTIKDSAGNKLTKNVDYKVSYASGRKNVGTYKVVITGINKYNFSKTLSFKIKPKATSISSLTSGRGYFKVKYYKRSTQVSGYQVRYSTTSSFKDYKTVKVSGYKNISKTINNLQVKNYYVKVRTYKVVNGTTYYSAWSSYKKIYISTAYVLDPNDVTCLVNKKYYLKDSYAPSDLTSIGGGHKLRKEAANAYLKMKKAINNDGIYIQVVSSYRTKAYQAGLYNGYMANDPSNAPYYSAKPRTSEHELGLAIDISNNGTLSSTLQTTKLGKWMAKNAYKYGFILRYPSDQTASTGYMFEPWHYRYVGVELATKLHKSGQTLEQYYGYK